VRRCTATHFILSAPSITRSRKSQEQGFDVAAGRDRAGQGAAFAHAIPHKLEHEKRMNNTEFG
jgi:hypothetical protein